MVQIVDVFSAEAMSRLVGAGWTISNFNRYDPTHVDGLTPTGKTFSFDAVRAPGDISDTGVVNLTLVIATHTFTTTTTYDKIENGVTTVDAIIAARNALPSNQR